MSILYGERHDESNNKPARSDSLNIIIGVGPHIKYHMIPEISPSAYHGRVEQSKKHRSKSDFTAVKDPRIV